MGLKSRNWNTSGLGSKLFVLPKVITISLISLSRNFHVIQDVANFLVLTFSWSQTLNDSTLG